MDLLNSLFVSAFGLSIVFFALILLIVMINVLSFAARHINARQAGEVPRAPGAVSHDEASAPGSAQPSLRSPAVNVLHQPPELKLFGVDEKTAAMIMAIVCDDCGIPPNELYFKSIRALD